MPYTRRTTGNRKSPFRDGDEPIPVHPDSRILPHVRQQNEARLQVALGTDDDDLITTPNDSQFLGSPTQVGKGEISKRLQIQTACLEIFTEIDSSEAIRKD